jgi:hypothetical protein
MKKKLDGNSNIASLPKPMKAIKMKCMKDIKLDYFQKLSDSLPRRLQMVIEY